MTPPSVAVLLAAGGGSRFTAPGHKLLAPLRGRPVWQWALEAVVAAGFDHVVVVTGAVTLYVPPPAVEHRNARWHDGQATSLHVAIAAAEQLGAAAVTIGLADQPFIPASTWLAVAGAPPDQPIVIATYDGVPGPNPVRLAQEVWPLLPTTGDLGARDVIREHPEWVSGVACLGSTADIDTLEDLDRWNR